MNPVVGVEADTHRRHHRRTTTTTTTTTAAANGTAHLVTRARLAVLCVCCFCQWVFITTLLAPRFAPGVIRDAMFSSSSSGRGVQPGNGMAGGGGSSGAESLSTGGDGRGAPGVSHEGRDSRRAPRILTVLTTYGKRSGFTKAFKEVVLDRSGGYRSTVSKSLMRADAWVMACPWAWL